MMKKPLIGVSPLYDTEKESYWMLPGYMKGIEASGGIPMMLPLTTNKYDIVSIAESFDGFLFTGGQDINPSIYREEMNDRCGEICDERDEMETILFNQIIQLDKPTLGICRGIQLFNALLGGTLYQDLPTEWKPNKNLNHKQDPPYDKPVHEVSIEKGNPLYSLLNTDSMNVNSYHHQGIKTLSNQLISVAKAEDGLIEAVYMPGKSFIYAVQWHPEFNYQTDDHNARLFSEFVNHCKG